MTVCTITDVRNPLPYRYSSPTSGFNLTRHIYSSLPPPATPAHRFPVHSPSHRRNPTILISDTPAIPTPTIHRPSARQPSRRICRFTIWRLLDDPRRHNKLLPITDNTYSVSAEGERAGNKGLGEKYRG